MNENLKSFLLKAQEDAELRERVNEACKGLSGDELAAKAAQLVTEEGYPITAEDLTGLKAEDLDEAELAQVAGGAFGMCIIIGGRRWSEFGETYDWELCIIVSSSNNSRDENLTCLGLGF